MPLFLISFFHPEFRVMPVPVPLVFVVDLDKSILTHIPFLLKYSGKYSVGPLAHRCISALRIVPGIWQTCSIIE